MKGEAHDGATYRTVKEPLLFPREWTSTFSFRIGL